MYLPRRIEKFMQSAKQQQPSYSASPSPFPGGDRKVAEMEHQDISQFSVASLDESSYNPLRLKPTVELSQILQDSIVQKTVKGIREDVTDDSEAEVDVTSHVTNLSTGGYSEKVEFKRIYVLLGTTLEGLTRRVFDMVSASSDRKLVWHDSFEDVLKVTVTTLSAFESAKAYSQEQLSRVTMKEIVGRKSLKQKGRQHFLVEFFVSDAPIMRDKQSDHLLLECIPSIEELREYSVDELRAV